MGTGKPGTDPPTKLKTKLAQVQGHHPGTQTRHPSTPCPSAQPLRQRRALRSRRRNPKDTAYLTPPAPEEPAATAAGVAEAASAPLSSPSHRLDEGLSRPEGHFFRPPSEVRGPTDRRGNRGPDDTTDGPNEYVLKISNSESSKTPDLIEVQSHIIIFLRAAGFPTASVCHTKEDNLTSLISVDSGSEIKSYLVRLLTYLPGRPIAEIPISPQLLYEIGRVAAKLDKTLEPSG
ncbi:PREDICTED: hydroxylysine kinase-like [Lipotes vexillifer]|uniref:Hydroxylysine kinase n=1 Tax=Lipotes vexillifer TaxID=118797 RepID=A0A340WKC5_LIPVE|nr:PREDICTED: hydroxylysine kinase-like [Lipotes vexillifer]